MSNRPCNYCEYQRLLKKYGDRLSTKPHEGGLAGTDVYLDGKIIVWYMQLPDHCCC